MSQSMLRLQALSRLWQLVQGFGAEAGSERAAYFHPLRRLHVLVPQAQEAQAAATPSVQGPINVACVLERLPVVSPPPPAREVEYQNWLLRRKVAMGLRSDYPDVKHIYAPAADARKKAASSDQQWQQQQKQDAATNTALQEGELPVPMTQADTNKNYRSMRRALSDRLYLLVNQPLDGSQAAWQFPHAQLQQGESIRDTCERALSSAIGRKYPVFFIGNAPMAYIKLTSGGQLFFMLAQVVDDPWGPLSLPATSPVDKYAWLTRDEAVHHVADDVLMAKLLPQMLPA